MYSSSVQLVLSTLGVVFTRKFCLLWEFGTRKWSIAVSQSVSCIIIIREKLQMDTDRIESASALHGVI